MQRLNLIKHSEKSAIEIVKSGLSKDGAIHITHHQIPKDLIKSAFEELDKLTSLQDQAKDKLASQNDNYIRTTQNELFTISAKYSPQDTKELYSKKNRTKEMPLSASKKLYEELFSLSHNLLVTAAKSLGDYSDTFLANKMYGGESLLILSKNLLDIESPSNLISLHLNKDSNSIILHCGNELMKHSHDYFEDMGLEMGNISFFAVGRK
jgi:hypothetical protein